MTFLVLLIIGGLAAALYHSASIAEQKIKEAEQAAAELKKLRQQYEELSDAYCDALNTIKELKSEVDDEPEYC